MKNSRKILIIGLTILFIILSVLVKFDLLKSFDNFIYNLFTITDTNTKIFKFITFFGSTLFMILFCLFLVILFFLIKKKNHGLIILGVILISTILNNLVKIIIARERPDVLALVTETSYSFPSGHMMAAVSMYGILLYLCWQGKWNKKLKIVLSIFLVLMPLLVGISRIYLGAHFASDIIGAFLLSTILLLIETYYIAKKEFI